MARILLTGGRAPATLELARAFDRAGHVVIMAESLAWHLSRGSRAVSRNYRVPPPRQDPAGFKQALGDIVRRERIDLLVPTCEEIFYVAEARAELRRECSVLAEPLERLHELHSKWRFVERARGYGLSVPATRLVTTSAELLAAVAEIGKDHVLKPVYSRFAARTVLPSEAPRAAGRVQPTESEPWVAQRFVRGRQVCTYSVAHRGRLAAHAAYPAEFTAGPGAAVAFRSIEHPAAQAWVETFVAREGFTGQIAFDFVETESAQVVALECNPRATSGVHLLAEHPALAAAFFGAVDPLVTPPPGRPAMLAAAMLLYGLPAAARSWPALRRWAATFGASRDVIFEARDPLPAVAQLLSLGCFIGRGLRHHVSTLEASTLDIEWNGLAQAG